MLSSSGLSPVLATMTINKRKPPPINTKVSKVQGPKVRTRNIEKSMESFIPTRRSKRK